MLYADAAHMRQVACRPFGAPPPTAPVAPTQRRQVAHAPPRRRHAVRQQVRGADVRGSGRAAALSVGEAACTLARDAEPRAPRCAARPRDGRSARGTGSSPVQPLKTRCASRTSCTLPRAHAATPAGYGAGPRRPSRTRWRRVRQSSASYLRREHAPPRAGVVGVRPPRGRASRRPSRSSQAARVRRGSPRRRRRTRAPRGSAAATGTGRPRRGCRATRTHPGAPREQRRHRRRRACHAGDHVDGADVRVLLGRARPPPK